MGKNLPFATAGRSPKARAPAPKPRPLRSRTGSVVAPTANVKVIVRARPFGQNEEGDNHKNVLKIMDEQMLVFDPKNEDDLFFYHGVQQKGRDLLKKAAKDMKFVFDRVFGFDCTNQEVFEDSTKNLISSLMEGYNCSVFAYGATGAGKTFTMLGTPVTPGITYLTMAELFKTMEERSAELKFELGITYLEVYNELVRDLLNPGPPLQLREDAKYGVHVAGIKMHKIQNPDELFDLLARGNGNRTQHPTDANAESSRSHAVFQVYIKMDVKATCQVRAAKLSMIDLAGSERGSVTGFGGARFQEGANINKSLLALGNCINSLADGQRHVPYRDSKLTRLLKDSLGGNCQTVMIANVSPSSLSYEDTYNTLKYASRAKKIKSNMKKNVVTLKLAAGEYAKVVDDLKRQLEEAHQQIKELQEANAALTSDVGEPVAPEQQIAPITNQRAAVPQALVPSQIDPEVLNQLMQLFDERNKIAARIFNVELSETTTLVRRELKEEANSNLSDLCETPDKEDAHRRLGNAVERFHRQGETYKAELVKMEDLQADLEKQTQELVGKHPELVGVAEVETEKLATKKVQYQNEIWRRKYALMSEEYKSKSSILGDTCKMLQSCFMQLKGHGFASNHLVHEYQGLTRRLQGYRNITWDEGVYTPPGQTTFKVPTEEKNEGNALKRKADDDKIVGTMDATFVLPEPKNKAKLIVSERMHRVSPMKRPAQPLNENRRVPALVSRPTVTVPKRRVVNPPDQAVKKRPAFRT